MWCRASTTTLFAQIPEPDTIFTYHTAQHNGTNPLLSRCWVVKEEKGENIRVFEVASGLRFWAKPKSHNIALYLPICHLGFLIPFNIKLSNSHI